ncbi:uncharacterized protein HI_0077 isoform X2 [Mangifera indica]|uniref:uncharacterized protein HI_0077 isoform X2 n=1 Tax=Mangifera indica TaxID=29780 RepID=UPI001CFB757F|nr:uncharacterized protein HI_0077 isoform X2 [Mangifera indica]
MAQNLCKTRLLVIPILTPQLGVLPLLQNLVLLFFLPLTLFPNPFFLIWLSLNGAISICLLESVLHLLDLLVLLSLNWFVSPKEIPSPKNSPLPLNAYMLHNLAHVELNAIDLAWDTVVRFSPYCDILGEEFFADFARVADDESRHFAWCSQRLAELGVKYGDMPAHNVLWNQCEKSSDNVAARLAVIPLVQEARGLDAGPRLVQKLIGFGDHRTSNIVARIADEEVAHVAVGVYWFLSVCQKMDRAPCSTFKDLLKEYNVELKGPFNYSARDEAGIPRHWYDQSSAVKQDKNQKRDTDDKLSVVYERLASIISMESENSSLNSPPR